MTKYLHIKQFFIKSKKKHFKILSFLVEKVKRDIVYVDWLIDFNGTSTHVRSFYA